VSFSIAETGIEGVRLLTGRRIGDERGFLERLFCAETLRELLGGRRVVQINHTRTTGRGTVRGLHCQLAPAAEMKLVHCLSGRIFDVAADLRIGSPTWGRWHAAELDGETPRTFLIPEGCAHGFQVLSDACELIYLHTAPYTPELEAGVNARDTMLAIEWPLEIGLQSERDRNLPGLGDEFAGIEL
jgi:dTDP-4-dehydrorhamnose 3,5-epimerase